MTSNNKARETGNRIRAKQAQVLSSQSRRFLWLIWGDEGYGFRRANLGMVKSLRERNVEIAFVSMQPGRFADEVTKAGFPIWYLNDVRGPKEVKKRGWKFFAGCMRLIKSSFANKVVVCDAIRSFRPDWIHISINSLLITGGLSARKMGVPVYWHIHNTIESKLLLGLQAFGYQVLCRIFGIHPMANSRHTAQSLGDTLVSPSILYPGTDAEHFNLGASFEAMGREAVGLDSEAPVFMIAARLVPEKAQDRVVEATIELFRAGHRFSLMLVGGPLDTPFSRKLVERVKAARAQDWIRFVGQVEDTRPYVQLADVVINSRTGAEPFGLSVVEAMLMERPVLAYSLGGPSETVVDGTTGWLIDDPTVHGYRQGLLRALGARETWTAMGKNARRYASSRFSLEATTESYLRIAKAHDRGRTGEHTLPEAAASVAN